MGPLLLSFVNAMCRINFLLGTRDFVGFKNYSNLFSRKYFWESLFITLKFAVMSVPMMLVVDLFVANKISQFKGNLNMVFSSMVFIPFIVSMAAAGIVWDWLLDPNLGLVNNVLMALHLPTSLWLRSPDTALYSTLLITLWIRAPFGIMILLGGISNVPGDLYEAADLDGVNAWQKFWKVTLPLINPQMVMVFTLETIYAFRAFDQIYTSTGGGPGGSTRTLMIYLIKELFNSDYGMASALTVLMLACLFLISLLEQSFLRRKVDY
ncbi:MAG: sugar ABC transporter permease [Spirochaetaceae bacterium]|nr:sugar ABC transporter permease [Spirochaetaceae bacterium]